MVLRCHRVVWLLLLSLTAHAYAVAATPADEPDFARDVRPLLSQYCFKCHGPDEKTREGGLRLDDRTAALQGGDSQTPAIAPGKAHASELIKRITSTDPDSVMPPPSTKRSLTAEQVETLRRWVEAGAAYAEHWAFQPVSAPDSRMIQPVGTGPIDALVAQAAAAQQLTLAGPADRGTWLRRIYLDLIGLPPTYDEVLAFEKDSRPDAKQRIIDRLLASPALGERWARRWLDLARYADTNGYEKDRPRSIWPYRDWVIRAINDDMPLDEFAIKQLAGDLLPGATQDDRIATGFHRNTMINEEGGIDPLEYRYYAMVDRVNTTSTAWLGLTMGCCQCHDHKYDPISQRDYFGLMALLNNAEEPEMEVVDPVVAQQQQQADAAIAQLMAERANHFPTSQQATQFLPATLSNVKSARQLKWTSRDDGTWQSSGKPTAKDTTTLEIATQPADATRANASRPDAAGAEASQQSLVAIRLKAIAVADGEGKPASLGWSSSQNFVITSARLEADGLPPATLSASATYEQPGYPASDSVDGSAQSGWAVGGHAGKPCEITWTLAQPLPWPMDRPLRLILEQNHGSEHLLRGFQLSLAFDDTPPEQLAQRRREYAAQAYAKWLQMVGAQTGAWQLLKPTNVAANMARLEPQNDGSYLAIGDISKRDEYQFQLNLEAGTTALMIEGLTDPSLPKRGPGRTYYEGPIGDFFLSEVTVKGTDDKSLTSGEAWVDFAQAGREATKAFDGDPLTGWSIDGEQGSEHRMVVALKEPLTAPAAVRLSLLFERYYAAPLGRVRIWSTRAQAVGPFAAQLSPEVQNLLAASDRAKEPAQSGPVWDAFLSQASELSAINGRIKEMQRARPKFATTLVMQPRPPGFVRTTHRYHRGEFLNPREEVQPSVPTFLTAFTKQPPQDRLQLAQWLMNPDHPLVARVLANRYWSALMGRGLVNTEEDFGFQGSFPVNQPLLDYLAADLVGQAHNRERPSSAHLWSFKRWLRQILISDTYARASDVTSSSLQTDPTNQNLARMSRRRMEAEQLRDAALASAGLLSRTIGGPSVYPPQPASVTTEGTYGKLAWPESHGADRYRRGLYTFSKRTAPFAMLTTFDAPSGESCVARREAGDTPLQALTVLNDTLFLEAAKELGYRTAAPANSPDAIVRQLFHTILLRDPTADELADMSQYLMDQAAALKQAPESLKGLGRGNAETELRESPDPMIAAATLLARVLLNTDEFINRN